MSITTMITVLLLLLLASAYFSATETAFSSLSKVRLKNMAEKGDRRAEKTLSLAEDYDRLLSTILIGNNIVNIAAASMGTILFTRIYGDMGATISTIVLTVAVLIFGEVSPKSLAKEAPERFARFSTPIIQLLQVLFTPLNFFFKQWKRVLSKVFHTGDPQGITEEELITIIDEAEEDGDLGKQESELIRSAIEFHDLNAEKILTHRIDLVAVDDEMTADEVGDLFRTHGFTRLPVYHDNIDNITGILHEKDFFRMLEEGKTDYQPYMKPALFVPENLKISSLMKRLQQTKTHLAVAVDEFGGTAGIVTLEDILEELVGEIWDEHDQVVENIRQVSDDVYFVSANTSADELFEDLELEKDPDAYKSNTVGGWVMEELGKVPEKGDAFQFEQWRVTVVRVDERRVQEICLKRYMAAS